jgi:hypothetical protein
MCVRNPDRLPGGINRYPAIKNDSGAILGGGTALEIQSLSPEHHNHPNYHHYRDPRGPYDIDRSPVWYAQKLCHHYCEPATTAAAADPAACLKDWEIIADNLSKAGWSWGCVSAIDREGRTI